ncbi:MAG: SRPBCC family protein [Candidatus Hodarchaeota archaeon]
MAKIERKVEINSSPKKIYDILNDETLEEKWNITVKKLTTIEPDKYSVKTTVGDIISTVIVRDENKEISMEIEGGPFSKMGYVLTPKGDSAKVMLWAEFENPEQESILGMAGDMLLESLKKYVDFLEDGGNPAEYNKKK